MSTCRNPMARKICSLGFVLTVAAASPLAQQQTSELGRQLEEIVRSEVKTGFSGALIVQHRGEILLDKGYGVIKDVEMKRETRFWIASLGKQFTSAAVLRCQDLGLLKLDDPMSR